MSKPATIHIVYKLPGLEAEVRTIPNTLEAIQTLVGGHIDCVRFGPRPFIGHHAYVHDEGLLIGLAPNFRYMGQPIVGPAVFSCIDDSGEEIGFASEDEALRACHSINRARKA